MSDRNGTGVFANMGSILIFHMAIDIGDPTRYLVSVGYKANESTMHHLNVISNTRIPVPPIPLQNNFAAFVQQIDKSKFVVQKSLEKTELLYKALMQLYFS